MRSLLLLFLLSTSLPSPAAPDCGAACTPVLHCAQAAVRDADMRQADPGGWLLLAGLVVAAAGRLALHPRR